MTDQQRQALYDAMMAGGPDDPQALIVLEEVVTADLDVIEPIIDGFIKDAQKGTDWKWEATNLQIGRVISVGTNCIIRAKIGERLFNLEIEKSRLRSTCEFLIRESGA